MYMTLPVLSYVVTHQHSGDPAIHEGTSVKLAACVVTHQHSGDPAIKRQKIKGHFFVVTHQHSGDPAIYVS